MQGYFAWMHIDLFAEQSAVKFAAPVHYETSLSRIAWTRRFVRVQEGTRARFLGFPRVRPLESA
jgi:hypothetical protein